MRFTGDPTCQVCCSIVREHVFYTTVIGCVEKFGFMAKLVLVPLVKSVESVRATTREAEICPEHGKPFED
jgi:hypothetical protein